MIANLTYHQAKKRKRFSWVYKFLWKSITFYYNILFGEPKVDQSFALHELMKQNNLHFSRQKLNKKMNIFLLLYEPENVSTNTNICIFNLSREVFPCTKEIFNRISFPIKVHIAQREISLTEFHDSLVIFFNELIIPFNCFHHSSDIH